VEQTQSKMISMQITQTLRAKAVGIEVFGDYAI
jgi:hypothetical protein